jgi:uncharacterized protein with HEPN domain
MPPTLGDRLQHILAAIEDIQTMLSDCTASALARDRRLRLAVERAFEIMSEASRHIPEAKKTEAPEIAWRKLADLGNRLRHAYHRVDPEVLWNIAHNDLEPLKRFVERIIKAET